jgi:hypothetical protein
VAHSLLVGCLGWPTLCGFCKGWVRSSSLLRFFNISFLPVNRRLPRTCKIRLFVRSHPEGLLTRVWGPLR